jgi:GntR family transcriptional regulator
VPLYHQIELDLRERLQAGEFASASFPTDQELCARYKVSRMTVHHALRAIEAEGLIVRQRGRRTIVRPPTQLVLRRHPAEQILSFEKDLRMLGVEPTMTLLSLSELFAGDAVAAGLAIAVGAPYYEIRRLGIIRGEPVWIERHLCPPDVGAALQERNLGSELFSHIINDVAGPIAEVSLRVTAEAVNEADAELLEIPPGQPLLTSNYVFLAMDRRPLDHFSLHYRADRVQLDFMFETKR